VITANSAWIGWLASVRQMIEIVMGLALFPFSCPEGAICGVAPPRVLPKRGLES